MDYKYQCNRLYSLCLCEFSTYSNTDVHQFVAFFCNWLKSKKCFFFFLLLAAALIGLASAPFWTAQATYISRIARYHAHHKQKNVENTISLFFGIFFAAFSTSTIWGNLITYFVLNQANTPQRYNCGIHFSPLAPEKMEEVSDIKVSRWILLIIDQFDLFKRYTLCGIFGGIAIISLGLLLFLDQIRLAERRRFISFEFNVNRRRYLIF